MKKILGLALVALTAGCMYDGRTDMDREGPDWNGSSESLAAALGGRVQAGPPQSCVNERTLQGNRSVGEGAIIFQTATSSLVYVNTPPGGCPVIDNGRAIRVRTPSTQLCRGDIVEVFDPVSGFDFGSCGLGDFTPYRRPR